MFVIVCILYDNTHLGNVPKRVCRLAAGKYDNISCTIGDKVYHTGYTLLRLKG